jgi:hypothetical protein
MNPEQMGMNPLERTADEISELNKKRNQYKKDVKDVSCSELRAFIDKILLHDGTFSAEEVVYSDAKYADDLFNKGETELLDEVNNTSIILENRDYTDTFPGDEMTGYIDGKKIEICTIGFPMFPIKAKIDGKKISEEDAKKIFNKYFKIANERKERLNAIYRENRKKLLMERGDEN